MNYNELSKEVSYALRHAPWEYELEMDEQGWVSVEQLLNALHDNKSWKEITIRDLEQMILTSEKKRHEIINGKMRAFYGHSLPMKIQKIASKPPEILYHGTVQKFAKSIMEYGLLPQSRQYVHLSQEIKIAYEVGRRRDENPVILKVNATKAYNEGVKFYYGNEKVWLSDNIPINFIEVIDK